MFPARPQKTLVWKDKRKMLLRAMIDTYYEHLRLAYNNMRELYYS